MLKLQITAGPGTGKRAEPSGERFVIGQGEGADWVIDDAGLSGEHVRVWELKSGRLGIEDLGSPSGTFVNGHRLTGPVSLSGGEEIRIGQTTIEVLAPGAVSTRVSEPPAPTVTGPPPTVGGPAQTVPSGVPTPTPPPVQPPSPPPHQPAVAARPAAEPRKGRVVRVALLVFSVLVLLAVGAAAAFVLVSGGPSEALHRAGIGGGWEESYIDDRQQACEGAGGSPQACGCFVDKLQDDFSQSEYEEVVTQVESDVQSEDVARRAEIAAECGVDLS